MKLADNFSQRMTQKEFMNWQFGNSSDRVGIALKYLENREGIVVDSLGQNIISSELENARDKIKKDLLEGHKVLLYPVSQKSDQFKQLIIYRN